MKSTFSVTVVESSVVTVTEIPLPPWWLATTGRAVAASFEVPTPHIPPTTTYIADRQGARRRGSFSPATGEGSGFSVVACCLLYFTKSILAICRCRIADV